MLRIDFIQWNMLWAASQTVAFSSANILDYKLNGDSICDLYFNQTDVSYIDIVIDYNDISAYWDYLPLTSPAGIYSAIWKYGCKIYNDNTLIFTGVIFLDTVKIDKEAYKFAFTVLSVIGFISRANQNYKYTIPSDGVQYINNMTTGTGFYSLFQKSLMTPFAGVTAKPSFTYAGSTIISPFFRNLNLQDYGNNFSQWDWDFDWGWDIGNWVDVSYNVAGIFPVRESQSGGVYYITTNRVCFFLYQERHAAGYFEGRLLCIVFEGIGNTYSIRNIHKALHDTDSTATHRQAMMYNLQDWINIAEIGAVAGEQYFGDGYILQRNGDYWQYSGSANINAIRVDPANADVNPFETLADLLMIKQSVMTNTADGNIICKIRPLTTDTQTPVDLTSQVIGNPTYSGVFVKSIVNNTTLAFIVNVTDILNYIKDYFQSILNTYRVKLNIKIDGSLALYLGNKIRYQNKNYILTKAVSDYENNTTDIEAYGAN